MTYVVFLALPSTSDLTIADAAFILIFGGIGMAIPVQGGIGTYHVSVAFGLSLYGIARKDGLVYATLAHESQMLLMIVLGIFSLIMVALIKGKKKQNIRITE